MDENTNVKIPDTLGLMFNTLKDLGCQPVKNDDSIDVMYHGQRFHMQFLGVYCRVWNQFWIGVEINHPSFPIAKRAINEANITYSPTNVFSWPDENGIVGFHSRQDILLHESYPDNVGYVKTILDEFFVVQQFFRNYLLENNVIENRYPDDFTTKDN